MVIQDINFLVSKLNAARISDRTGHKAHFMVPNRGNARL